jgi:hypothetical protein
VDATHFDAMPPVPPFTVYPVVTCQRRLSNTIPMFNGIPLPALLKIGMLM